MTIKRIDRNIYKADGNSGWLSLVKLTGHQIKDVIGYVNRENGCFVMVEVMLDNGKTLFTEGEHDEAYLSTYPDGAKFLVNLEHLTSEWEEDDDEWFRELEEYER